MHIESPPSAGVWFDYAMAYLRAEFPFAETNEFRWILASPALAFHELRNRNFDGIRGNRIHASG
jgi:hypothetical protein